MWHFLVIMVLGGRVRKQVFLSKEAFLRSKRLGKRNMRLLLVLHILFLMTYMASGLYAMNKLFQEDFVLRYCFMAVIELILWLLADIMVWIASSKGRLVYFAVNIISLYGCYYLWQIFQFPLENLLDQSIRLLFVLAYFGKTLLLFCCGLQFYQEPICYVWQRYERKRVDAEKEDQLMIDKLLKANEEAHQKRRSNYRIAKRAMKNMRIYTMLSVAVIYGGLLLFYLGGFVCKMIFQNDVLAMDYAQRFVLLTSLFSALIWSLPTILLFLNHAFARLSVVVVWGLQAFYYMKEATSVVQVIQHEHYSWLCLLVIVLFESVRIGCLWRLMHTLWKDPFLKAYWKLKKAEG